MLVDMASLQSDLLVEGQIDRAARVGRALLTLAELLRLLRGRTVSRLHTVDCITCANWVV